MTHICEQCNAPFARPGRGPARFCSKACQYAQARRPRHVVNDLTVEEAAYLAGLMDGEGSIHIEDRRQRDRPGATRPMIYVSVTGSHVPMLQWISAVTGVGTITLMRAAGTIDRNGIKSNRSCYQWRALSHAGIDVLRQLTVYMIEKRDRAETAIALFDRGYAAGAATGS